MDFQYSFLQEDEVILKKCFKFSTNLYLPNEVLYEKKSIKSQWLEFELLKAVMKYIMLLFHQMWKSLKNIVFEKVQLNVLNLQITQSVKALKDAYSINALNEQDF